VYHDLLQDRNDWRETAILGSRATDGAIDTIRRVRARTPARRREDRRQGEPT